MGKFIANSSNLIPCSPTREKPHSTTEKTWYGTYLIPRSPYSPKEVQNPVEVHDNLTLNSILVRLKLYVTIEAQSFLCVKQWSTRNNEATLSPPESSCSYERCGAATRSIDIHTLLGARHGSGTCSVAKVVIVAIVLTDVNLTIYLDRWFRLQIWRHLSARIVIIHAIQGPRCQICWN